MSADSQRLKSALRRIVLESPELRELLGDSDNRGDQAGSAGVGTSEAEESRLCCDGSTSDNANPGTDERDPNADGAGQDGLDPNDPADITSGDGTLSGVTNCATGEPICFDGAGFIPPDGWDAPNEPPLDEEWEEGFFYEAVVFNSSSSQQTSLFGITPTRLRNELVEYFASNPAGATYSFCDINCAGEFRCYSTNGREQYPFCTDDYIFQRDGEANQYRYQDLVVTVSTYQRKLSCSSVYISQYCDIDEPPRLEEWPSDGCTNLAIVNGQIVGSKYDPENDGSYSAPMDEIQLCSGSEQIGLKPAANGGWKTVNASADSGYLWDSHGRKIAHIDGNEYSDPDV